MNMHIFYEYIWKSVYYFLMLPFATVVWCAAAESVGKPRIPSCDKGRHW